MAVGHGSKKVPDHLKRRPRAAAEGISAVGDYSPKVRYPIGTLYHARLALIYVMSPSNKAARTKVMRGVAKAWPDYNWSAYWNREIRGPKKAHDLRSWDATLRQGRYGVDAARAPRSAAIKRRRAARNPRRNSMGYGRIHLLQNPYGLTIGKGRTIRAGSGTRSHILDESTGVGLCGAGSRGDVRASKAKVVTCYRCIKLVNINSGHDVERELRFGKRRKHLQIPGGRQGRWVAGLDDHGDPMQDYAALVGDEEFPTQSLGTIEWLTEGRKKKRPKLPRRRRRKAVRATKRAKVIAGVANPRHRRRRKAARVGSHRSPYSYQQLQQGSSSPGQKQRSFKMGVKAGRKDARSGKVKTKTELGKRTHSYLDGYLSGVAAPKKRRQTQKGYSQRGRGRGRDQW